MDAPLSMPEQLWHHSMHKVRLRQCVVRLQSSEANARLIARYRIRDRGLISAWAAQLSSWPPIKTIATLLMAQSLLNISLQHMHSQKHLQGYEVLFSSLLFSESSSIELSARWLALHILPEMANRSHWDLNSSWSFWSQFRTVFHIFCNKIFTATISGVAQPDQMS